MRHSDNRTFWRWFAFCAFAALVMAIAAIRYDRLVYGEHERAEAIRLEAQQREEARVARFEKAADQMCEGGWYPLNEYTIQCALHNGQKTHVVQVRP